MASNSEPPSILNTPLQTIIDNSVKETLIAELAPIEQLTKFCQETLGSIHIQALIETSVAKVITAAIQQELRSADTHALFQSLLDAALQKKFGSVRSPLTARMGFNASQVTGSQLNVKAEKASRSKKAIDTALKAVKQDNNKAVLTASPKSKPTLQRPGRNKISVNGTHASRHLGAPAQENHPNEVSLSINIAYKASCANMRLFKREDVTKPKQVYPVHQPG